MQVSKWGNSLAIRLPAALVEALQLKQGDEIKISVAEKGAFKITRDLTREKAVDQLKQMGWSLPAGFKFNRDEANER